MKQLWAILCCMTFASLAHAQVDSTTNTNDTPLDQQIEILSENVGSEDADLTALTENLRYYKEQTINLHTATRE